MVPQGRKFNDNINSFLALGILNIEYFCPSQSVTATFFLYLLGDKQSQK